MLQWPFFTQYDCLKLIHFSEKLGRLSSTGSEILAFRSHCSANFQPILDCFIPKFKLKYDNLENIKTDRVNTVVFNLLRIKQSKFFLGHPILDLSDLAVDQKLRNNQVNAVSKVSLDARYSV